MSEQARGASDAQEGKTAPVKVSRELVMMELPMLSARFVSPAACGFGLQPLVSYLLRRT